ncbi:MAG: hypothetical protein RL757_2669 [Bacteroidota bacterium]
MLLYLLNKFFDMKKAIFFFSFMALLPMFIVAQKVKKVEFRLQMGGHLNDLSYAYSEAEPTKSGIHGNFMVRFSPFGGISCWSGLQYIQRGGRSDFFWHGAFRGISRVQITALDYLQVPIYWSYRHKKSEFEFDLGIHYGLLTRAKRRDLTFDVQGKVSSIIDSDLMYLIADNKMRRHTVGFSFQLGLSSSQHLDLMLFGSGDFYGYKLDSYPISLGFNVGFRF